MLKAAWETNDGLSEEFKIFLRQRDAAEEGLKACVAIDYPLGKRVKVESLHKGVPHDVFGPVISHRIEEGAVEIEVENERTGHLRKFDIRRSKITLEEKPIVPDATQASIDAFMARDDDDLLENQPDSVLKGDGDSY